MKKGLIIFLFFIQFMALKAQDFHGSAVYILKNNTPDLKFGEDVSDDAKKKLLEKVSDASKQFYILNFDKTRSVYQEDLALISPVGKMRVTRTSSSLQDQSGKIYKDIKNKILLIEKDFLGKSFLVSDSLQPLQWTFKNETKQIGDYLCYKAVAEVTGNEVEDFIRKKMKASNKTFATESDTNSEIITAWYTPDIPVNQGPKAYWGLPGLILEVNTPVSTILCSKIILNGKDNFSVKIPVKGKKVTIDQYSRTILDKLQEMENME